MWSIFHVFPSQNNGNVDNWKEKSDNVERYQENIGNVVKSDCKFLDWEKKKTFVFFFRSGERWWWTMMTLMKQRWTNVQLVLGGCDLILLSCGEGGGEGGRSPRCSSDASRFKSPPVVGRIWKEKTRKWKINWLTGNTRGARATLRHSQFSHAYNRRGGGKRAGDGTCVSLNAECGWVDKWFSLFAARVGNRATFSLFQKHPATCGLVKTLRKSCSLFCDGANPELPTATQRCQCIDFFFRFPPLQLRRGQSVAIARDLGQRALGVEGVEIICLGRITRRGEKYFRPFIGWGPRTRGNFFPLFSWLPQLKTCNSRGQGKAAWPRSGSVEA